MPHLDLIRGDITTRPVDAIVNAANPSLLGGSGVDGAIHRAGGPAILDECRRLRQTRYPEGLPTGQAVATTAGDLPARWVIHTVGPVYADHADPRPLLRSAYQQSLRAADELGARSVAFPAISCGVYGYPLDEAAAVAVGAILQADTQVERVELVLFDEQAYEAFAAVVEHPSTDVD